MSFTSPNRTWVVGETVTASIMNQYVRDQLAAMGRLGRFDFLVAASAGYQGANIIDGAWAECNAQLLSRSTYSAFDALLASLTPARPFGVGDGVSTLNVPDLFGRSPVAIGSHADVNQPGKSDGQLAANRTPQHTTSSTLALSGLTISGITLPNHVHDHGTLTLPSHAHAFTPGTIDADFAVKQIPVGSGGQWFATNADQGELYQASIRPSGNWVVGAPTSTPPIDGQTGNPTTNPSVGGTVSGGSLGGGVGPQGGGRPIDAPGYLVAGIWVVKVLP